MDHLGAGIHLLEAVGDGDGVELAGGAVALENAGGILPCDGRAGLDLRPAHLGIAAPAIGALGDEIVDAAPALGIARIPVLDGGILDLALVQNDQLHHRRMQLVFVAHRRGAAFQIAHVCALVGDDEGALELAGLLLVDAEIGGQLHGAAHALRDIDEGAIGEDGGIERGVEIVARRHDGAEIFPDQIGIVADGLRDGAEDDARLGQLLAEGGNHRNRVEDRVHGHFGRALDAGQNLLLLERNAELLVGLENFRIQLV